MIRLITLLCAIPFAALADVTYFVSMGGSHLQLDTERLSTHIQSLNHSALDTMPSAQQMKISASTANVQFGLMWGEQSKVLVQVSKIDNINYADTSESQDRFFSVQILDIAYQHSFNNFGLHCGVYLGGGLTQTIMNMHETDEEYASKNQELSFSIDIGYEHQFNKYFITHIGWHVPITSSTKMSSKGQKEMQYKKFSSGQEWWGGKSASYQADNKYKYFVTDNYDNKRLFSLSRFSIGLGYIF